MIPNAMSFHQVMDELGYGTPRVMRVKHRGSGVEITKDETGPGYSVKNIEPPEVALTWALNSSPDWYAPMTFGDVLKHAEAMKHSSLWVYRRPVWEQVRTRHVYFTKSVVGSDGPRLVWNGRPLALYTPTPDDMMADDWTAEEEIPF